MKYSKNETEFFVSADTMKCTMCRARTERKENFRFCPMCGRRIIQFIRPEKKEDA